MKAQITVATTGKIGLHTTTTSPTDDVLINGQTKITNGQCYLTLRGYYTTPQIYPYADNSGSVGISGNAFANMYSWAFTDLSDKRKKENIRDINGALDLILKLKGVKYDIKKEFAYDEKVITDPETRARLDEKRKNKIGFLAQDVNEILPEVVVYDDSTDIYGIEYGKIVPVLVEAIKELSAEIELLKNAPLTKSATIQPEQLEPVATLGQNVPNPFSSNTQIQLFLPKTVSQAALYVYNMQGAQIKKFNIRDRENTSILIEGNTMEPGMYLYTLIADGKEVDTKKMILTK